MIEVHNLEYPNSMWKTETAKEKVIAVEVEEYNECDCNNPVIAVAAKLWVVKFKGPKKILFNDVHY